DSMPAQHPPNLVVGDVLQRRGQQGAIPARIAFWRRLVQLGQDAPFALAVVGLRFTRSKGILQTVDSLAQKSTAPLAYGGRTRVHRRRDRLVAGPGRRAQNYPGTKYIPR